MSELLTAIAGDGSVVCYALDSTDMVAYAEKIHRTSATVTAALGRLLTAASMMGSQLKGEGQSITLRISGGGPVGAVIAVADDAGNARGYVLNPIVEIPLNKHGKLDVAGAVGTDGTVLVMKDLDMGEPYIGQTPIVSGEIAEDITAYFAASEQVPTVCALGVLVDTDLSVIAAGGFIAQLLPGADDEAADRLEKNLAGLDSVTKMLHDGMSTEQIALQLLDGFEPQIIERREVAYRCDCSRERTDGALISLGREELLKLADEQNVTEIDCHFCNKKYRYNPAELRKLAE